MFGFGKKKNKKPKEEENYYRPQPVSLQRGWATTSTPSDSSKKKSASKKNSGSLNKREVQPAQPQPSPPASPQQSAASVQRTVSDQSLSSQAPLSAQSGHAPLQHASTSVDVNKSVHGYSSLSSEHKHNESVDSSVSMQSAHSSLSAMSSPMHNNNNKNYNPNYPPQQQQPPPSAMAAYSAPNYKPRHGTQDSNRMEEGQEAPSTGAPVVVGDISDYRAHPPPPAQSGGSYPSLHQANYTLDGYSTGGGGARGGAPGPILQQSRTSGTANQLNGIEEDPPAQQLGYYNQQHHQMQMQNNNGNQRAPRLQSAADDQQTIIASSISAYNPHAPNVPEEDSSSDDDLNDLVSGKALQNSNADADEKDDSNDAMKQKMQMPIQPAAEDGDDDDDKDDGNPQPPPPAGPAANADENKPAQAEEEEEEEEDDDDGGLSDWLISIGFKKKKLAQMLAALSDLGLDTMDDLETLLIDLYKNSYGNQQKQWMDKIQQDIMSQGIKFAQWIQFSTKAQAMVEYKVKQQMLAGAAAHANSADSADVSAEHKTATKGGPQEFKMNGVAAQMAGLPASNAGFIVMQSEEAQQLENLQNAMSLIYSGIENLDKLVLTVQDNEKTAIENIEREFGNLLKQIENRKQLLLAGINGVGEDKCQILGGRNAELRSIAAVYEDTLAEFNRILADNQKIRGKNEITKRQQTLSNLVFNVLNKNNKIDMTPNCTPLIGFHCNITPVVLEVNKMGIITWGNAPQPPTVVYWSSTDWSITVQYDQADAIHQQQQQNVAQDPVIAYEIQCVLCKNEENLLWNFEHQSARQKQTSERKHKKKYGVIDHGIVTKQVTSKQIVLVGFVAESKDYVVRVRCQNRNGWSTHGACVLCKTKKKKKRKPKVIMEKLKILRHRGSAPDCHPNNVLFSNDKLVYQSLSNQDFINELNNFKKLNKNSKNREFNDWIIFDLGTFIELITFRIKFDTLHPRWGNVPRQIYLDIADYDDHAYSASIIKKYKPMSYDDDYHNPSDPNQMSGVLVQLRKKRLEQERVFESIWNRLAIIECKKKPGWQDFNLFETIDESKRKGQYVRIQFVNNFDCSVEHYAKFVVEQLAFVGVSYDD